MPHFMRSAVLGAVALLLGVPSVSQADEIIFAPREPPSVRVETPPPQPPGAYTWRAGHWGWRDNDYVWISGEWVVVPKPGAVWISGHWEARDGRWAWIEGHWGP